MKAQCPFKREKWISGGCRKAYKHCWGVACDAMLKEFDRGCGEGEKACKLAGGESYKLVVGQIKESRFLERLGWLSAAPYSHGWAWGFMEEAVRKMKLESSYESHAQAGSMKLELSE